jgi:hypothetical protein
LAAKLVPGLNLLPGELCLFRREEARTGLAFHGTGKAEIGAMACLWIIRAGTPGFAALDGALG